MKKPFLECMASFPSLLTFDWFNSVIWNGFKRPLKMIDLWSMSIVNLDISNVKKKKGDTLLLKLCKKFKASILFGMLLQFLQILMTFVSPLILA